jgi:hypothetical protein
MSQTDLNSRSSTSAQVASYPLLEALLNRRSRRFGKGMRLNGGPLAYASGQPPQPLSLEEEAALAFAGCGVTGYTLGELPYQSADAPEAGNGNILMHFVGRTVASGDGAHCVSLFVINDDGAWMLKRPQDYPRAEIGELAQAAREQRLVELYEKSRVRIADRRLDVPRELPFTPPFNKWSANLPGTTFFLPVAELTALAINVTLFALSEECSYYALDERNRFRPAGLARFARSKGGHLYDDPKHGRVATVEVAESWLLEFAAIEQGAILQNLGLMTQALGLGGFAYFAAHPSIWMQTLGFRMEQIPFARTIGAGPLMKGLLQLLRQNPAIPTAVGLEHNRDVLIKPFCPPYYHSMKEAVLAFVDYKCGRAGTQHDGGAATSWREGASVQAGIPRYSDQTIAATIAYCEYIYERYGRFPRSNGPFRTVLAYQAHHLDLDFYGQFYRAEALTETQRQHEQSSP